MDPIADFLTQIKNASATGNYEVKTNSSKLKEAILGVLKKEGFINDFKVMVKKNRKIVDIYLCDGSKSPRIQFMKKISKPGRRVYSSWQEIPRSMGNLGLIVISTPLGVMAGSDARKKRIGGELICEVRHE